MKRNEATARRDMPSEAEFRLMKQITKALDAAKLLADAANANSVEANRGGLLRRAARRFGRPPEPQLTRMEIAHATEFIAEALQMMVSDRMQRFIDRASAPANDPQQ